MGYNALDNMAKAQEFRELLVQEILDIASTQEYERATGSGAYTEEEDESYEHAKAVIRVLQNALGAYLRMQG